MSREKRPGERGMESGRNYQGEKAPPPPARPPALSCGARRQSAPPAVPASPPEGAPRSRPARVAAARSWGGRGRGVGGGEARRGPAQGPTEGGGPGPGALWSGPPGRSPCLASRATSAPGQGGLSGGGLAGGRGTGPAAAAAFSSAANFHKAACPASSISINNSWLGRGERAGVPGRPAGPLGTGSAEGAEPGAAAAGGGRK